MKRDRIRKAKMALQSRCRVIILLTIIIAALLMTAQAEKQQVNIGVLEYRSEAIALKEWIVTLKTQVQNEEYSVYGAVIFTKADRDDINELDDLGGKSFMSVGERNFGGWQVALRELKESNIDISDFSKLKFSGFPPDSVVYAVQGGEVDAGTVRTGILESMALEGKIDLRDFKALNQQKHEDFPLLQEPRT